MLILPANQKGWLFHYWTGRYPGQLGHLWSPGGSFTVYPHVPFALDNGCFSSKSWSETTFIEHCDRAVSHKPLWLVVPDAPFDCTKTLDLWQAWYGNLVSYGIPLAMAVQDGMTPEQLPETVDVIFVGGSDAWKYESLESWVATGLPVHVGRVNGKKLWACDRLGVASCDGTGWFRGDQRQLAILEHYLKCTAGEAEPPDTDQLSILHEESIYKAFLRWQEGHGSEPQWQHQIPTNIERSHLLTAIAQWNEPPTKHLPFAYAVEHEGLHYPPKLLISRANFHANGQFWPPRNFSGGRDCHAFLRKRGFSVVPYKQEYLAHGNFSSTASVC